jgi:hypothetical protein
MIAERKLSAPKRRTRGEIEGNGVVRKQWPTGRESCRSWGLASFGKLNRHLEERRRKPSFFHER